MKKKIQKVFLLLISFRFFKFNILPILITMTVSISTKMWGSGAFNSWKAGAFNIWGSADTSAVI